MRISDWSSDVCSSDLRQRRHAQEQADEQQAQAPETRMQVAARDPPTAAPAQPYGHVRRSAMIRPSRISTMRSHRSASAGSWVMMTSVASLTARRANNRSMIALLVPPSRLPEVGKSVVSGKGVSVRVDLGG